MEVIPLDHIGTDPNAAMGFMNRRYDLSATGLSNAELQAALRPLLTRQLLRDVRFRLREVVRLSTDQSAKIPSLPASLAKLAELAKSYPDLESAANPVIPAELFAKIDAAIVPPLPVPAQLPDVDWQPPDPLDCALECHLVNLLWDLREGGGNIERTLAALDVKSLTEGVALNLVGIMIKNRFYADNGVDYAAQQCLEGFGTLDLPQQIAGYKPRPLEGVWATAPFLHNGSVPTLYQMLLPPAKRDTKFFVGRREYDPRARGLRDRRRMTMATMTASGSTPPFPAITTRATRSRPTRQPGQSICRIRKRIRCRTASSGLSSPTNSASTSSSTSRFIAICRRLPPTINLRNAGCAGKSL